MVQNGYNMFNRMIKIPLDGQVMAQRAMDAVQLGPQMHGHKIQYLSVRNMNQYHTRHMLIYCVVSFLSIKPLNPQVGRHQHPA